MEDISEEARAAFIVAKMLSLTSAVNSHERCDVAAPLPCPPAAPGLLTITYNVTVSPKLARDEPSEQHLASRHSGRGSHTCERRCVHKAEHASAASAGHPHPGRLWDPTSSVGSAPSAPSSVFQEPGVELGRLW